MKAYGVKRKDAGCCPGHDKYPQDSYGCTRRTARHARLRSARHSARAAARRELRVHAGERSA